MAKKEPIGKLKCFLCDFPDGEVKTDKNDKPYFYCPNCSCQVLTHGGQRAQLLQAKMKPVAQAVSQAMSEMEKPQEKKEVKADDFQTPDQGKAQAKQKTGFML